MHTLSVILIILTLLLMSHPTIPLDTNPDTLNSKTPSKILTPLFTM